MASSLLMFAAARQAGDWPPEKSQHETAETMARRAAEDAEKRRLEERGHPGIPFQNVAAVVEDRPV